MSACRSALLVSALAAVLGAPAPGFAQDDDGAMTFGEEEAEEVQEGEDGGGEQESDEEGMTFGEEEAEEAQQGGGGPVVGVVAVPSPQLSSSQRADLQAKLVEQMKKVPDIQLDPSSSVLDALRKRTVETCVTERLCLGAVGEEAGVEYITMLRVTEEQDGTLRADLDYFRVGERLFEKLGSEEGLDSVGEVRDEIEPLVVELFDLETREQQEFAEQNTGAATRILAISTGALAVGGLVGGIVFGNQASDTEDELAGAETNENGVFRELTQREARQKLEDAESDAQTANIFFGLAGAFAVTSGILLYIDLSSGDSAEQNSDQQRARKPPKLDLFPTASSDGAGFSARIRF